VTAKLKPPLNIVLVGFMGSGKTTVGRLLAGQLGFLFADTDRLVVEAAGGRSIPEIFEAEGEEGFRRREAAVLEGLAGVEGVVVSTGGGIVTRGDNRALLPRVGYVVWLAVEEETIIERVGRNRERPMLYVDDPLGRVRELLAERTPWYEEVAQLRVDTCDLVAEDVAYGIAESARIFFAGE